MNIYRLSLFLTPASYRWTIPLSRSYSLDLEFVALSKELYIFYGNCFTAFEVVFMHDIGS
jgi:hypothetical protein